MTFPAQGWRNARVFFKMITKMGRLRKPKSVSNFLNRNAGVQQHAAVMVLSAIQDAMGFPVLLLITLLR
jgi:hypothetical protein